MSRYTPDQLARKAKCKWTLVQYIGAPIQMLLLVISLVAVIPTLNGDDSMFALANGIIILKFFSFTLCL